MNQHDEMKQDPAEVSLTEMAAQWFDCLADSPVSRETRAAFERWLAAAPEHRMAYAAINQIWRFARQHAADPEILALRHEAALRLTRAQAVKRRGYPWAIAAASTTGCVLGVLLWSLLKNGDLHSRIAKAPPQATVTGVHAVSAQVGHGLYRTADAERLTTRLEDGSQITLNSQTALETWFTATERRIVLKNGQAYFEVAKERNRPFSVEVNGRRVVALGTAFDIRVQATGAQVTITEGAVEVEPPVQPASPSRALHRATPTVLDAGHQLTFDVQQEKQVRLAEATRVADWRLGQVVFEDSTLADAVAELNRYSRTAIRLEPSTLGQMHISGAFVTGDAKLFIEAVTTYFPIRASQGADEVVLHAAR